MSRLRFGLAVLILLVIFVILPSYQAQAVDDNAGHMADSIQTILPILDSLGSFDEISDPIPLTESSLEEVLGLDAWFTSRLSGPLGGPFENVDALASAINGAGDTIDGLTVNFSNAVFTDGGTVLTGRFDVQATRAISLPFSTTISETNTELVGGGIGLNLEASGTFEFEFIPGLFDSDPELAIYLTNKPLITVKASGSGAIDPLTANLGIMEVGASGTSSFNLEARAEFVDPDGDTHITRDEWQSTAVEDLFEVGFVDSTGNDVYVDLTLSASQMGGVDFPATPSVGVLWQVADIRNDLGPPSLTWNDGLDGFTNLSADELLTGVAQSATGLVAAQSIGDMPIPFIDGYLSDAFYFAQPLIDFVEQQGLADINCGTEAGTEDRPPQGGTAGVTAGDTVYCRAYTLEDAISVTWSISPTTTITNATDTDTVGQAPSLDVYFKAPTDGDPDVSLALNLPSFGLNTIVPRFDTVQELFDQLRELGGFEALTPADVAYNPNTFELTYHLHKALDPAGENTQLNFGDQLEKDTGLSGLTPGGSASASFNASDIELDFTFGVVLAPDVPEVADRFFLRVRDDAPEFKANVEAEATIDLAGRIGFIDVTVNGQDGKPLKIGPATAGQPMVAVDLAAPGYPISGTAITVANALGVSTFLKDVGAHITATCNVSMTAGLEAQAQVSGLASASGSVDVTWSDVFESNSCKPNTGTLNAQASGDFENQLQVLDLSPGLFGEHTEVVSSTMTLSDTSGVDFTAVGRALEGVRLINKDDGSSCVITDVSSQNLTCEAGLQGGERNYWQQGDAYEVEADPFAMLNLILDNIEEVVSAVDNVSGGSVGAVLDAELPLLPLSPRDVVSQFRTIQNTLDDIRTGGADAVITCGPINVNVIGGAFDIVEDGLINADDDGTINGVQIVDGLAQANTLVGIPIIGGRVDLNGDGLADDSAPKPAGDPFAVLPGAALYCQAVTPGDSITAVQWSGSGLATAGANATNVNTVGPTPTALAEFTLSVPSEVEPNKFEANNYRLNLSYSDAGGGHGVSLPSAIPPASLKFLEELIEAKLGIPEQALVFELTDLPPAGEENPDGVYDLVMRLGYGVCTKDNEVLDDCNNSDNVLVPRYETTVSVDLADANIPAGLVGLQGENTLSLEYLADAQLDMAIPMSTTAEVMVLNSTGLDLELAAAADDVNFKANVGPLSVFAGTSAVFTGTHTSEISSTTTLTDDSGTNFLTIGITDTTSISDTIVNTTDDNAYCSVTDVTANTVTCDAGLSGDETWDQDDVYQIGGNGVIKIGVGLTVSSTVEGQTTDIDTFIDNLSGGFVPKVVDGPCTGDACAALSLALAIDDQPELYFGDLTLQATLVSGEFQITPGGFERLLEGVNSASLDWLLLFKALPELLGQVENGLEGAANNVEVPLVGDALDAGADVAGTLEKVTEKIEDGVSTIADNIGTTPAEAKTNLEDYIEGQLDTLISEAPAGSPLKDLQRSEVEVTITCDPSPCGNTPLTSLATISDVRVTFVVSQSVSVTPTFDLGIPGVPLRSAGTLDAGVSWSLLVDFGLSKEFGPYLVAHDKNSANHKVGDTELTLSADVKIGENPGDSDVQLSCNHNDPLTEVPGDTELGEDYYAANRCLLGEIAFLQVHLRDSATNRTRLGLDTGLNVLKDSNETLAVIGFRDLVNRSVGIELSAVISTNVDLRLRTGLVGVDGFPTVMGTFKLTWAHGFVAGTGGSSETADPNRPLTLGFDNLWLDAGSFVSQFLYPVTSSVQDVTSPLMPVIETVSSPLPVLSDLSRMTGGGDVSLITLMENATGSDLTMLRRVLEFIRFANSIDAEPGQPIWIPLGDLGGGSFGLQPDLVREGVPTSGKQRDLIDIGGPDWSVTTSSELQTSMTSEHKVPDGTFGVGGLTFPFIQEPTQIFGLLMGEDATLVRYDAGTMRATASVDYTFRFAVGPIPMSVSILGTATLEGRFAMGYDTYGIRQVVNGDSPVELLNGIFIDDLDADGRDVPEITLKGTIAARAAVDLVVVSAGVEGGIELTVNLDLDDRPDPDGKLRLDEIVNKLDNPICLFVVSGKLDAFFAAFVKIDFFLFSKTWRFELARVTLLDFSLACEPPQPKLAKKDGTQLILLMGSKSLREERGVAVDKIDEDFTVRMLENGGVSVAAFGEYQTFYCGANCEWTRIIANAGDGDDVVSIEAGSREVEENGKTTTVPIPFTIPVTLNGGDDNDELRGGDGIDIINGGAGNDTLKGGGARDTIHGNGDDDAIDGGLGNDYLYGDDGDDRISGGPGADHIYGGIDDDQLNGGPGTNEGKASDDLADTIVGNAGSDSLSGGFGGDTLYGDEVMACSNEESDEDDKVNADLLEGGPGVDHLFGGPGDDELIGGDEGDELCGNGDDDLLIGDGDKATVHGIDTASGGPGNDTIHGDGGGDTLKGNDGNDIIYGSAGGDNIWGGDGRDLLYGEADGDTIYGDDGESQGDDVEAVGTIDCNHVGDGGGNADCIFGDEGDDFLYGEGGHDFMYGGEGVDTMDGNAGSDTMRGGKDFDTMNGNGDGDFMYGDSGNDLMHGNDGDDTMRGGMGVDTMFGDDNVDIMYGDADDDIMEGNDGNDFMYGNAGDDDMEGNGDIDTMEGGPGQDDMIGGSDTAGENDAGDIMHGNDDHDVMLGDNGDIVRIGGEDVNGAKKRTVTLYDLADGNDDTAVAGSDTMNGDDGDDQMYGGGEADIMAGDAGDDYMQGNGAGDTMHGNAGQDDMIGGTSQGQGADPDGADTMWGGSEGVGLADDFDVMAGDNAQIEREVSDGAWVTTSFSGEASGAVLRTVTLYNIATVEEAVGPQFSGGDMMYGEDSMDIMYGQGNGPNADDDLDGAIDEDPADLVDNDDDGDVDEDTGADVMHGGGGDDFMEGNAGVDWMYGDDGHDDMIGGTGLLDTDPSPVHGRLDAGDYMFGGPGFDVMAGDNAVIARVVVDGQWQSNIYNGGWQHLKRDLLDIDSPDSALVSGDDYMEGNGEDDLMYGQGGGDTMYGGDGHDLMEGNAGADFMYGENQPDDMIGGTVDGRLEDQGPDWQEGGFGDGGDLMDGGGATDVMVGDNGRITRQLDETTHWIPDPNRGDDPFRDIQLYDLQVIGGAPVSADFSGPDLMQGGDGSDLMFGQGNGPAADPDGDGRVDEDPLDGIDNDLDGRESGNSIGYDCADGSDNDGDGQTDGADLECMAAIDEDGPGDQMWGQAGDDYMEGNHGSDLMAGGPGQDDMLGGSSAGDGLIKGDQIGLGVDPTELEDGHDVMRGDGDPDAMLGDNGRVSRPVSGAKADQPGVWLTLSGNGYNFVQRDVLMTEEPAPAGAFGHDYMEGNGGEDEMYGQQGDDFMQGNDQDDVMVGDLGNVETAIEDGSREEVLVVPMPFISDTIYVEGTLYFEVELFSYLTGDGAEGDDIMLGGAGMDAMHGGAGADIMNGNGEEDHLFGGDGPDVMWGGPQHDHLYGGWGDDYLDVVPRTAGFYGTAEPQEADPPEWFTFGSPDNFQDIDYIYGGWDQDALQASDGGPGPVSGDRLIDWVGAYNVYYVCPDPNGGPYGEGVITRILAPQMISFLQDLAEADGALDAGRRNTSGFREVAIVFAREAADNAYPIHEDHPGHFTCLPE